MTRMIEASTNDGLSGSLSGQRHPGRGILRALQWSWRMLVSTGPSDKLIGLGNINGKLYQKKVGTYHSQTARLFCSLEYCNTSSFEVYTRRRYRARRGVMTTGLGDKDDNML